MTDKLDKIDSYEVLNLINKGTSGEVFLVTKDHQKYALKLLKNLNDPAAVVRFRKESATLARLNSENLVKIYNFGEYKDTSFIVMEYLEGDSIEARLKRERSLPDEISIQIIKSVAKGLVELHKYNLVHRDIKPANILFTSDGTAKLIDLGLAADLSDVAKETALVGTPMYCAPEQTKVLKRPVDFRSDLYSLGAVLFELLTGKPPISGTLSEILQKHASFIPADVREFDPKIRPSIALITKKLLSKDPDDRYQTASGLIRDIDRAGEIDEIVKRNEDPKLGKNDYLIINNSVNFVEKTLETKQLKEAWNIVLAGTPGIGIVTGPSGSGKSRLCSEFIKSEVTTEKKKAYLILTGKCQLFDRDIPFGALREALDSWGEELSHLDDEPKALAYSKIIEAGQGCEKRLCQFSKSLQRIFKNTENIKNQNELNAEGEREIFLKDISNFFINLCKKWDGMVLFIDDLQWLDDSSLQLIETIFNIESKNVLFLLGTSRDDHDSQTRLGQIRNRLSEKINTEIRVSPFSREQFEKLVSDFLGQQKIEAKIIDQILLRADGNPFIAIEYLRAGIEQGLVHFQHQTWSISENGLEALDLSENIYSLIVKRADKLNPKSRRLLQYAALWGGQFVAQEIAEVARLDSASIGDLIKPCEEMGLVEKLSTIKWKFIHDKIQESMGTSLNPDEATQASDELADYYERKDSKSPDEIFSLARVRSKGNLAKHYEKAIKANIIAGNLAITNFAYSEAKVMFTLAYELTKKYKSSGVYEHEIAPRLATCATITGDWQLAKECADLNIKLSKSKTELQLALMLKVWTLKNRGDYTAAFKYFEAACTENNETYPIYFQNKLLKTVTLWFWTSILDLLGTFLSKPKESNNSTWSEWQARRSDLYQDASWCADFNGWRLDYFYISLKLLQIGLQSRRPRELAIGYSWMGHVYGSFGAATLAKIYFKKADDAINECSDKFAIALCKQKQLMGLYNAGLVPFYENGHKTILTPEHEKYLPPTQAGYSNVFRIWELLHRGMHIDAEARFRENLNDIKTGKTVLSDVWVNTWYALNYLQLVALGKNTEAQSAKFISMKTNYKNRFIANSSRITLTIELTVRRILQDLDKDLEELIAAYMGGSNLILYTQMSSANALLALFNTLNLIENCKDASKAFSLKSDFNKIIRKVNWYCFTPQNRGYIYFLKARYYKLSGNNYLSEHFLKKSEKLAGMANSWRTLYDINRELAKLKKEKGDLAQSIIHARTAFAIAQTNNWIPNLIHFEKEFQEIMDKVGSFNGADSLDNKTRQTGRFTKQATTSQVKTIQQRQSEVVRSKATSVSSATYVSPVTQMGNNSIEDVRFIDVLLEVTQSFVESTNPLIQSKSVLTQIIKLFGAERGMIFIKNENTQELEILSGKTSTGEDLQKLTGFSGTVVKRVYQDQKPTIITGTEEGEAIGSESAVLHNLRSIMATPLKVKEEVIGVVYLDSSLAKGLFTKDDIQIFSTLSNHISVAFELSRMAKIELEKANLKRELDIQSVIATESKKVSILVDNMRQALFSINKDGTIIEPISKFSKNVFNREITGTNILETLYSANAINSEKQSALKTTFTTTFGEDEMQWNLMEDHIPKKVILTDHSNEKQKALKIMPAPIWDDSKTLEKIMFVVEDVTELDALERKMADQKYESAILEEIIENSAQDISDFLEKSKTITSDLSTLLIKHNSKDSFKGILRDLHTLKGNARLYGLKALSEQAHMAESAILNYTNAQDEIQVPEICTVETQKLQKTLATYRGSYEKIFSRIIQSTTGNSVNQLAITELTQSVSKVLTKLPKEDAEYIETTIKRLNYKPFSKMMTGFRKMVSDISKQLAKEVQLKVEGEAFLNPAQIDPVRDCMTHLLRNAIDHGIEFPHERVLAKKNPSGTITVKSEELKDGVKILISDDGGGIDRQKVCLKALKLGLVTESEQLKMTDEEKLELLFTPGFSTKDSATDISGRGIGLDAVRAAIHSMGGSIKIQTELSKSTTFLLTLPYVSNYQ